MADERKEADDRSASDPFYAFFRDAPSGGVGSIITQPIGYDLGQLIRDHGKQMDVTGAVYAAMLVVFSEVPNTSFVRQANLFTEATLTAMVTPPLAADGTQPPDVEEPFVVADFGAIPDGPVKAWGFMMIQALNGAKRWLFELTAAQQVRRLNASNISNYFMGYNGTVVKGADIIPILDMAKNQFERIMADPFYRGIISDNNWMRYHTAASSTPALIRRAIADTSGLVEWDPVLIARVDDAFDRFWDKTVVDGLPRSLLAFTHAYLKAMKQLPDDWKQGEAAVVTGGAINYALWVKLIKKFAEIKKDSAAISEAEDLPALLAAIPPGAFNFDA